MKLINRKKSSNGKVWKVIEGAALLGLAVAFIYNLPDIKRYIKITTM